ncbi:MAG TPA: hypothetical protein VMV27_06455 [Candidatus Binataceae bacterium]|nr:hypothetical protein [Candidatus Binataceae bacterium]
MLAKVHLQFAELYGLYERNDEPIERMMSGFAMHDLETFPQSYPKPDLTHYPAWSVIECGELWSFSKGAGILARRGAAIIGGLRMARAILVYPICKPWDKSESYAQTHFSKPCEAVEFPYGISLEGEQIWVQPMVLEGAALEHLTRKVFALGFETKQNHSIIRFENPIALKPSLDRPAFDIDARVAPAPAPSNGHGEMNGNANP